MYLFVKIDTVVTAAGLATVVFGLGTDAAEAFSSPTPLFSSGPIAKAALTAGAFTAGIVYDLPAGR